MRSIETVKSPAHFQRVLRGGTRVRRDGVTAIALGRGDGLPARVGLAVRVGSGAVGRNRVKRRLREAWRASDVAPGFDVVIQAGDEAGTVGFEDLKAHVTDAVGEAVRRES